MERPAGCYLGEGDLLPHGDTVQLPNGRVLTTYRCDDGGLVEGGDPPLDPVTVTA